MEQVEEWRGDQCEVNEVICSAVMGISILEKAVTQELGLFCQKVMKDEGMWHNPGAYFGVVYHEF